MYNTLRQIFADDLVTECRKAGCELQLSGITAPFVILDCDRYRNRCGVIRRTCDYTIFVCSPLLRVVVIEMKGGRNVEARAAADQVQAGATMIESTSQFTNVAVDLYPVVLHSGIKHANEYKVLARRKVVFRGRKYGILLKRCGSRLQDILQPLM